MRRIVIGTLMALTVAGCGANPMGRAFAGQASAGDFGKADNYRTITVTGEGIVRVAPDTATSTVAVETQALAAGAAQTQVNAASQGIIAAWKALGVAETDMQTVGLDLHPEYAQPESTGKATLSGYRATLRMSVRSRPARAGSLIDAALSNGANRLEGVNFSREDVNDARKEAIRKAIQQGMDQAKAALAPLSLTMTEVREIHVGQQYVPPIPMPYAAGGLARAEMASTPVQPGEVEVRAQVTIKAGY